MPAQLGPLLEQARQFGFLGPGPVEDHITRSLAFASAATVVPAVAADLGTGGGVPALVLLQAWADCRWWLIESNQRRANWLHQAVDELGAGSRCEVLCARAEEVGRSDRRATCHLVTARGFGPPGPTVECGAPLLRPGGELLVAGPPDDGPDRWPTDALAELSLAYEDTLHLGEDGAPTTITRLRSTAPTAERFPRRTGVPFKRPLF